MAENLAVLLENLDMLLKMKSVGNDDFGKKKMDCGLKNKFQDNPEKNKVVGSHLKAKKVKLIDSDNCIRLGSCLVEDGP